LSGSGLPVPSKGSSVSSFRRTIQPFRICPSLNNKMGMFVAEICHTIPLYYIVLQSTPTNIKKVFNPVAGYRLLKRN